MAALSISPLQKIIDRTLLNPLMANLWMWSLYSEEKGLYFNGYVVKTKQGLVIIDPPSADNDLFEDIRSLGTPYLIFLTNSDHERVSDEFRKQFNVPVAIHALDAPALSVAAEKTVQHNETIDDVLQVIHIPSQKTPGEAAVYLENQQALVLGDALIGKPSGTLSMLPSEKYDNIETAKEGLEALLDLDCHIKAILVSDGDPILENAQNALVQFFA